jgi:hypothetical protein
MELFAVKTWHDQHHGVVEIDDDVQSIVSQVKVIGEGRIHVFYNEQTGNYDLVEHCLDGVQRLIFSVRELDGRVIHRLRAADHWLDGNPEHVLDDEHDFAAKVDNFNEMLEARIHELQMDEVRDAGERLHSALKGRTSILVPRSI